MNEEEVIETLKTMKENIDKKYLKTKNSVAIETVLNLLEKKDKIIYEIAKSNVKLKGYDVEETYINNTISFYTKYIENLERNPHWRKEQKMSKADEMWLTIKYNENYEISNLGNVRNRKTKQILRTWKNSRGYLIISIRNEKKTILLYNT